MNGWEIKPLGAFTLLALLAAFFYIGYMFAKRRGWMPGSLNSGS